MSKECNIVRDLLPLYVEGMTSADSAEFIKKHLGECGECQAELDRLRADSTAACAEAAGAVADVSGANALKDIKRRLQFKKAQAIVAAAALAMAVVALAFSYLTAPIYLPYSNNLLDVSDDIAGRIAITLNGEATGYDCVRHDDATTGVETYDISAWTTTWDRLFPSNSERKMFEIAPQSTYDTKVYYLQNNGDKDIVVYDGLARPAVKPSQDSAVEERVTLPRTALGAYALVAGFVLAVLAVVRAVLRKNAPVSLRLNQALMLPVSYLVAQVCVKGLDFTTYSLQRDLSLIVLVGLLLWCALLCVYARWRSRKRG